MMPAFRAVLFAACILFGGAGCAAAQNLPVHVDPGARDDMIDPLPCRPAVSDDSRFSTFQLRRCRGRLAGFNVDLADAICARLEARCTIQAWPWNRVQDALADNRAMR